MNNLSAQQSFEHLVAEVQSGFLEVGLSYGISMETVKYHTPGKHRAFAGELQLLTTLPDGIVLTVVHPWDKVATPEEDLAEDAATIVSSLVAFEKVRDELVDQLRAIEEAGKAEAERCRGLGIEVTYGGVALEPLVTSSRYMPSPVLTMVKLDDRGRPIKHETSFENPDDIVEMFGARNKGLG